MLWVKKHLHQMLQIYSNKESFVDETQDDTLSLCALAYMHTRNLSHYCTTTSALLCILWQKIIVLDRPGIAQRVNYTATLKNCSRPHSRTCGKDMISIQPFKYSNLLGTFSWLLGKLLEIFISKKQNNLTYTHGHNSKSTIFATSLHFMKKCCCGTCT